MGVLWPNVCTYHKSMCPYLYGQWEGGENQWGKLGVGVGVVGRLKACTAGLEMPLEGSPICAVAGTSPGSC